MCPVGGACIRVACNTAHVVRTTDIARIAALLYHRVVAARAVTVAACNTAHVVHTTDIRLVAALVDVRILAHCSGLSRIVEADHAAHVVHRRDHACIAAVRNLAVVVVLTYDTARVVAGCRYRAAVF